MRAYVVAGSICAVLFGCRSGPPPAALIPPVTVTVVQRSSEAIPGTDGRLRVEAGDVTGGQVLVRVVDTATGRDLVPQRSMRTCDSAEFDFGGSRHAIGLTRLANFLTGDDFAAFRVGPADAVQEDQIAALLARIEASDLVFVRNGVAYDGRTTAEHLRSKRSAMAAESATAEQFLDRVASRSTESGQPYLVRLANGREVPLADWLRGNLSAQGR